MEKEITVTIHRGLDTMEIGLVQEIEKSLDETLGKLGYARTTSMKSGNKIEFNYYAFATVTRKG